VENREELLDIKAGNWSYEEVLKKRKTLLLPLNIIMQLLLYPMFRIWKKPQKS
jgi:hypothetical protein